MSGQRSLCAILPGAGGLSEENYPAIEHQMLDEEGHQAGHRLNIVDLLADRRNERIAANVGIHRILPEYLCDTSFAQQMHAAYAQEPDAILATYRSAAPVLWAVKSFYECAGTPMPILETVDVSRETYHTRSRTDEELKTKFERETYRLASIIDGLRIVVIDEFYDHGTAVWRAGRVAENAGAVSIHGMLGRWYKKLSDDIVDREAVMEAHREFMTHIGVRSASIEPQTKPRVDPAVIAENFYDDYHPYYGGVDRLIPLNKIRTSTA